ncbi:VOC family protein [Paeniglutamicibacter sp. ABSL32-1]|uniref:VOC family protein n=1 Tax=Paeniglutamicibacter quisquiliarum TaxID=2849498 RepID=UPI001C2D9681|nr:VOC family protein [Paeniglutamicibacter quisquiliarum]MBV1778377.1 VOC family protein [Paeniglutamicibacter quisquiliarum]
MTPITPPSITALTLGVRDVQRSRDFYVTGLGFREISFIPGEILFVQAGFGLLLALWNVESMPGEYGQVGHGTLAPPLSVGHNTASAEEVSELYAGALAAGATSVSAPTRREWGGTSACVADPDGFRWDFVHNPSFAIDDDGTVTGV